MADIVDEMESNPSTISAKASSDPPNISIMVLRPKAALFLFMKIKLESISTERLARRDAL